MTDEQKHELSYRALYIMYRIEDAGWADLRGGRPYKMLEINEERVTVAISGLRFGRFTITHSELERRASEKGITVPPRPIPPPAAQPQVKPISKWQNLLTFLKSWSC